MSAKRIPIQWRLKYGLLYVGLNQWHQAILTSEDQALVFDDRDNPTMKLAFFHSLLGCPLEVEHLPGIGRVQAP